MNINGILELQSAKGKLNKKAVIEKYKDDSDFCTMLFYALNPLLTYGFTETSLEVAKSMENIDGYNDIFNDFFECCDMLSKLTGIDNETANTILAYLSSFEPTERDIYIGILSKTLRLCVTGKTVNQVIEGLIPEWDVQQAFPIDKYPIKDGTEFWLTEKLNGVRATFYNNKLISRTGIPYEGLEHIIEEISWVSLAGFVLDGELTLLDKSGMSDNEAFRTATGIINSDNVNKTSICYTVFDMIPTLEFELDQEQTKYSIRRRALDTLSNTLKSDDTKYVSVLPVLYHGTDISEIDRLLNVMVDEDKEGLMLNTNVPYKRTRHKGILKIKRFYTLDLPIIGYEEGSGKYKGTLGSLVVGFHGNEVRVGSGLSDAQRDDLWENREDLIGDLCEVKYKEISTDKNTGMESLQFPVFVRIREDKTEESYG